MTRRQVTTIFYEIALLMLSSFILSSCSSPTLPLSKPRREVPNSVLQTSSNAETFYQQGIEKVQNGKYEDAIVDFTQAIQRDPNFAEAYLHRGRARIETSSRLSWQDGIADFSEAIRLKPDYVQAYYSRGLWRTRLAGDATLGKLLAPDVIKQYQQDAIADLTKAIQLRPTFAAAYYLRAIAQSEPNKWNEQGARKDFIQVIQSNPNLFDAYLDRRDLVRLDLQDSQKVLNSLTQTLKKNPKNLDALYQRGFIYLDLNNAKESIKDFNQIIQQKPSDKDAYYGRGFAYYRLRNYTAAIQDLSQTIRLNPTFADAYLLRALAYLGAEDYQSSIKDSTKVISLDPDSSNAYFIRGLAWDKLGQRKKADEDYGNVNWPCITCAGGSGTASSNPAVYYDRGIALARRGDKQGAVNSLKKAANIFQTQGNQTRYQETLKRVADLQR
jgi:tetratricopeptide (TPR) repeat protein